MSVEQRKKQSRDMIRAWAEGFLRDCRVRDLSPYTITYYRQQLEHFCKFADSQNVVGVLDITPDLLRAYLLDLEKTGHNPGGRHAKYRAVRAFLLWWEREAEPESYSNPIAKVRPPKVTQDPIEGASIEDIRAMVRTCGNGFTGLRDRAILLFLLDSGVRVSECLSLNLEDVDSIGGSVFVRQGKGRKPRTVFIGRKTRRALRAYLRYCEDGSPALWVTSTGSRLAVQSLRGMLKRRATAAGVPAPSPHDFRRAFALTMLRSGVDVITLARLMGHTTLEVLSRYLKQTSEDLRIAHERASPVDRLL